MKKFLESGTKSKIIDIIKNKTLWFILLSIGFAFMYALIMTKNSNFYPINGDFQNYNPARRFLDGQIPFKDFSVYLGCGEMLLDALGLCIIGNTFTNSLIVIRFFNAIIFWGFTYVISYLISGSHRFSSLLSAGGLGLVSLYNYINSLEVFSFCMRPFLELEPGNSARLIRCGILPVEVALIMVAISVVWKKNISQDKKVLFTSIAVGFIAGLGVLWSNDYGIASALCISVCYALAVIKITKKFSTVLLNAGVYIASAVAGFLLSVLIITRGHLISYFENTLSISSFQKWYYKTEMSEMFNNYSIFDVEISIMYVLGAIMFIYTLVLLFVAKTPKDILKNAIASAMFLATLFASELYHLVSGNSSKNGMSIVVCAYILSYALFVTIQLLYKTKLISKFKKIPFLKKSVFEGIAFALCVILLVGMSSHRIYSVVGQDSFGEYLGNDIDGNVSEDLATPILKASEIIGDEEFFSTYASAIEVYNGKFQPTGFDYIIHVLGDKNRQKYLDIFKNGDYKYVITTSTNFDEHEYWIKNSNWFYYRELCSEYIPTYDNDKWIIWTKSENDVKTYDLSKAKLSFEKIDESSVKLVIEYDEKITGTADVSISYATEYNKSFFKTGNINKLVLINSITERDAIKQSGKVIEDMYFHFCLPEESDNYYIPVTIKDGYGELLITTKPDDDVKLTFNSAKLHNIFDFDYVEENLIKE